MKAMLFIAIFALISARVYCGGSMEQVNIQELELTDTEIINILYHPWEKVTVYNSGTGNFLVKEYMNRNNRDYFAEITSSGNTLTIKNGRRPFTPLLNTFNARLEIYIPASYKNAITIRTKEGKVEIPGEFVCSKITVESTGGNISVNAISAREANFKTTSGNVSINEADGLVSVQTSSGRVRLNMAGGTTTATTRSGGITCTAAGSAENISLETNSGGITLNLPRGLEFNLSARTSGTLSTPFPEKLSRRPEDKHAAEGVIGEAPARTINLRTKYGEPIRIRWVE
ncbi:MAG: DUF4097 domain-containing protein [Treponema sp.]|jgi:DUF4097 and DUF4098 domain-containing protein YvlB|nr:DUF4097 domain-containing protein [Treponema sp.]